MIQSTPIVKNSNKMTNDDDDEEELDIQEEEGQQQDQDFVDQEWPQWDEQPEQQPDPGIVD